MVLTERLPTGGGYVALYRNESADARGRCLLVPPFGLPAVALQPVASALALEGYEVVSFDARDHVGSGSGEIADFRLSAFADDCFSVMARTRPSCVIAVSLGSRATLRALAHGGACESAVLVTPVVDVHQTLETVLGRDWFAVPAPEVPPSVPVLGVDINAPRFLADCIDHDLVTPESTHADLARYQGRLTLICGTADPWVDFASVRRAVGSFGSRSRRTTVRPVECDRHAFHEDPDLAMRLIGAMIEEVNATHDHESMVS